MWTLVLWICGVSVTSLSSCRQAQCPGRVQLWETDLRSGLNSAAITKNGYAAKAFTWQSAPDVGIIDVLHLLN